MENISLENVYEIVIRIGHNDSMIIFKSSGKFNINFDSIPVNNVMINDNVYKGNNFISTKIGDYVYRIKGDSFFQINDFLNEKLYLKVLEYLNLDLSDTVLDLFCGAGTIGIFLSKYVNKVIGVEINSDSIYSANINKRINNISNISFICDDVGNVIDKVEGVTKVVVDPPRGGLSKRVIKYLKELNPSIIVYVSCNYHSLVRDLKLFDDSYVLRKVCTVDMFPRTYHVECVTVLCRKTCKCQYEML